MGNPDWGAPTKELQYNDDLKPVSTITAGENIVMYDYPVLSEISDPRLASKLSSKEMKDWIHNFGYKMVNPTSEE